MGLETERSDSASGEAVGRVSPVRELLQPFIALARSSRLMWGINIGFFLEGLCYFGFVNYLEIYMAEDVFHAMESPDVPASYMLSFLTGGITLSMLFIGFLGDRWSVRRSMITAFVLMMIGRVVISYSATSDLTAGTLWNPLHISIMVGLLLVVIGYGIYEPAVYAATRKYTSAKAAPMAYAMLYGLMNLGGFFPSFAYFVRDEQYLGWGIPGAFWVYTSFTVIALIVSMSLITRKSTSAALRDAQSEPKAPPSSSEIVAPPESKAPPAAQVRSEPAPSLNAGFWVRQKHRIRQHPLMDAKFSFFIFALIPVQTLFVYNWVILPAYVSRAFAGTWVGDKYEIAVNFNPLLIFVLTPFIAAMTARWKVYNAMIVGTLIMSLPTFLLGVDTAVWTLTGYIVLMTVGEAMWQPRFLQYAAEIAPEGKTSMYMGVARLPWFLTKVLVPLYSGYFLAHYCPPEGDIHAEPMWLIFGLIAVASPLLLLAGYRWVGDSMGSRSPNS